MVLGVTVMTTITAVDGVDHVKGLLVTVALCKFVLLLLNNVWLHSDHGADEGAGVSQDLLVRVRLLPLLLKFTDHSDATLEACIWQHK